MVTNAMSYSETLDQPALAALFDITLVQISAGMKEEEGVARLRV
jgi:hypothetical protein